MVLSELAFGFLSGNTVMGWSAGLFSVCVVVSAGASELSELISGFPCSEAEFSGSTDFSFICGFVSADVSGIDVKQGDSEEGLR